MAVIYAVLAAIDRQGELNIHDIPAMERVFVLGKFVGTLYALAVQLIVAAGAMPRLMGRLDAALVPPLFLAGDLLVPSCYRVARLGVLDSEASRRPTFEWAECCATRYHQVHAMLVPGSTRQQRTGFGLEETAWT